jgi:hypothetical protein
MKKVTINSKYFHSDPFFWVQEENNDVDWNLVRYKNVSTLCSTDNSGNVTFAKGEGVTQFEIFFGDATKQVCYCESWRDIHLQIPREYLKQNHWIT